MVNSISEIENLKTNKMDVVTNLPSMLGFLPLPLHSFSPHHVNYTNQRLEMLKDVWENGIHF